MSTPVRFPWKERGVPGERREVRPATRCGPSRAAASDRRSPLPTSKLTPRVA
jgi:hypothetical protein